MENLESYENYNLAEFHLRENFLTKDEIMVAFVVGDNYVNALKKYKKLDENISKKSPILMKVETDERKMPLKNLSEILLQNAKMLQSICPFKSLDNDKNIANILFYDAESKDLFCGMEIDPEMKKVNFYDGLTPLPKVMDEYQK